MGRGEPVVLKVYIHCEGCVKEVRKSLCGYEGVEKVEVDSESNRVTVKGKGADPIKVAERLRKKTGKYVELISPLPDKEGKNKAADGESSEPKINEVVLKMRMHSEECEREVKQCIYGMKGVQTVVTDTYRSLVTVKGTMDPKKLVKFISKQVGQPIEIVKLVDEENAGMLKIYYNYTIDAGHAPQCFSDENPNSCMIM